MKIREIIIKYSPILEDVSPTARLDIEVLICHVLGYKDRMKLMMNYDRVLEKDEIEEFLRLFDERRQRRPIAYIIGIKEFMGLEFFVDENVLIPRPDTEVIVEEVISCAKKMLEEKEEIRLIDMCTGSGAIALSVSSNLPKERVSFLAADISKGALEVCKKNKNNLGIDNVEIVHSDLFSAIKERVDIIVSNPPYIEEEVIKTLEVDVKDYEPMLALSGGDTGMDFYNRIIEDSREFLNSGGLLIFESGHDQAQKIKDKMMDCGFSEIYFKKDIQGFDRCVVGKFR